MGWMRILLNFTNPPPPLPPSPHATDVQNMVKLTICKFVLKHKLKSTKKTKLLNEKLMTIWLSMKYLKLTYVTSIQCILKQECNWFDNLKCTVYISFNCQIDGITDKSNIANKWKSKPRLCAILLPIRLVTDWLHTYIGLTNLIDGEAKCFLICWPINYLPCRVWIINTYERTWRFVTLQIFFC